MVVAYATAAVGAWARNDTLTIAVAMLVAVTAAGVFVPTLGRTRRALLPALGAALVFAAMLAVAATAIGIRATAIGIRWANLDDSFDARGGTFEWIFYEDARSFRAKLDLVGKHRLRGFSVWVLGEEDPAIWSQLPPRR